MSQAKTMNEALNIGNGVFRCLVFCLCFALFGVMAKSQQFPTIAEVRGIVALCAGGEVDVVVGGEGEIEISDDDISAVLLVDNQEVRRERIGAFLRSTGLEASEAFDRYLDCIVRFLDQISGIEDRGGVANRLLDLATVGTQFALVYSTGDCIFDPPAGAQGPTVQQYQEHIETLRASEGNFRETMLFLGLQPPEAGGVSELGPLINAPANEIGEVLFEIRDAMFNHYFSQLDPGLEMGMFRLGIHVGDALQVFEQALFEWTLHPDNPNQNPMGQSQLGQFVRSTGYCRMELYERVVRRSLASSLTSIGVPGAFELVPSVYEFEREPIRSIPCLSGPNCFQRGPAIQPPFDRIVAEITAAVRTRDLR